MTSRLGTWQPTRKDGKNWRVDYTITVNGVDHSQHRKFRVRADAADFIDRLKHLANTDSRITNITHKIRRLR